MKAHWNKLFEQLLKGNKDACLNLLCRLVVFYSNGNIEWDYHYKKAVLGESSLQEDNLLSRLVETFSDEKDVFESLLTLHNHCRSLTDVSNLKDDAFIKMAWLRQNSTS